MLQKISILILLLLVSIGSSLASTMDVYWHVNRYYSPMHSESFVEVEYFIPGPAVTYLDAEGNSTIALTTKLSIYQNDVMIDELSFETDNTIPNSGKPQLQSIQNQLQMFVPEGTVQLVFSIIDKADSTNFFSDVIDIDIDNSKDVFLSDILLVNEIKEYDENSPFIKEDKVVLPKFLNYYPAEVNILQFYAEYYEPNKESQYIMKYMIAEETGKLITTLANFKKVKGPTGALTAGFDISNLPSGNYFLYVELRNTENEVVALKRVFFQRSNQLADESTADDPTELDVINNNFARKYDLRNIIHHTEALSPIADEFQKAAIVGVVSSKNLSDIQNYFFSFWKNKNEKDPEAAWMAYAEKLQFVEENFGTSLDPGFNTERGRIYLQHGPPVDRGIRKNTEYGHLEIWYYEQIDRFAAIYFVFQDVERSDETFFLVHSNLQGENFSKAWADQLKRGIF